MEFIKKTIMTFGSSVFLLFFSTFTSIITARVLGPEGIGIYAIVLLIPNYIAAYGALSIGAANVYLVAKKNFPINDIFSNSIIVSAFFSIIYIALFAVFFGLLREHFFKTINPFYAFIGILALPLSFFNRYFEGIIRGLYLITKYNVSTILSKLVYALGLVIFLLLFKFDALGAVIATLLASFLQLLYMSIILFRIAAFHLRLNMGPLKESFSFGIREHIGNIFQELNLRLDMFFITALYSPEYIGWYATSFGLAELVWYIPNSIGLVLFPKISSMRKDEANKMVPLVCRNSTMITLISCVGLALLGKFMIKVMYGYNFLPSFLPLLLLLPGIFSLGIAKVLTKYTSGIGKPQYNTYSSITAFVFTVVLLELLVPKYNIVGAAIASSVAYLIYTVVITYFFIRESGNSLHDTFIVQKEDIYQYLKLTKLVFSKLGPIRHTKQK